MSGAALFTPGRQPAKQCATSHPGLTICALLVLARTLAVHPTLGAAVRAPLEALRWAKGLRLRRRWQQRRASPIGDDDEASREDGSATH